MMEIKTTAFGGAYINSMFTLAPERFLQSIRGWLYRERNMFVGSYEKDGSFRKKILRKKLAGRPGTWPEGVARNFRGNIDGKDKIQGMSLKMGVGGSNPFTEGLARMQEGFSTYSGNMMILPIYSTLFRRYAFTGKLAPFKKFKDMMSLNLLTMVRFCGKMYFFDREGRKEPLFVGAKDIHIKKQFNFTEEWQSKIPSVLINGQKAIDKTVNKMAKA